MKQTLRTVQAFALVQFSFALIALIGLTFQSANAQNDSSTPDLYYVTEASPVAITGIQATDYLCQNGGGQTLRAIGGSGQWGGYQWGTVAADGSHVTLSGEGKDIYVNPTTTTKYWVRSVLNGVYGPYIYKTVTYYAFSTQPTSIQVSFNACTASYTLTAIGGVLRNNAYYEWHIGYNPSSTSVIDASNSISINVSNPTSYNQGYFVRIVESTPCANPGWGANVSVNRTNAVAQPQLIGSITAVEEEFCPNYLSQGLTYQGNGVIVRWESATNAAFTSNVKTYFNTSDFLSGEQIGPLAQTTYFRAIVQTAQCGVNPTPVKSIRVATPAIYQNGTWSKQPSMQTPLEIRDNLVVSGNLEGCSCEVKNNAQVNVNSGSKLILRGSLQVAQNAQVVFEDKASLIQFDNAAVNQGVISKKVATTPMKNFDYTYWSSPVAGMTLREVSPTTLQDKYHSFSPAIGNWVNHVGGNQVMESGKGYIVRAPQGWSTSNATQGVYTATFTGVPTNGEVVVPISKGNSDLNLIGNPYASGIDVDVFITQANNADVLSGTVYFWTHTTALAQVSGLNGLNYIADDYAKYNLTGGVGTGHPAMTLNAIPTGKIASGQGFFVRMNTELGTNAAQVTFENNMRMPNTGAQFFRQTESENTVEKNRIWLHLSNSNGAYNQALVGYISGATNGKDRLFDGETLENGNSVSLYSIVDETAYSIQGRALPFETADTVALGFKVQHAGNYTIGVSAFDGLFASQEVFIYDRLLDVYHNIKLSDYHFTTAAGRFEDRFEVRYTEAALGTSDLNATSGIMAFVKDQQLHVQSALPIQHIRLFDLAGRSVFSATTNGDQYFTSARLACSTQVVILQVQFENGTVATQKLAIQ